MGFFSKLFSKKEETENEAFSGEVEDAPFIEPYDFFIEADERFDDVKTIKLQNFTGTDPVEILEQMNLCDDVKNHSGVRRKIRKLYAEVSEEIDGYESYDSGKTAESSLTEEIDERELEISVSISRNSDSEPFEVSFGVKQV